MHKVCCIVPHLAPGCLLEGKGSSLVEGSHFENALVEDSHQKVGSFL